MDATIETSRCGRANDLSPRARVCATALLMAMVVVGSSACETAETGETAETAEVRLREGEASGPRHHVLPDCTTWAVGETSLALVANDCGAAFDLDELLTQIEPEDVVTSAKQGSAFLRRVSETHCGGRRLTVADAHMGHIADANAWNEGHLAQLGEQLSAKLQGREFPLQPTEFGSPIYDGEYFQLWIANEHFAFEPDFVFDFERSGVVPTHFEMRAGGKLTAGATLKMKAKAEVDDLAEALEERLDERPIYESEPMFEVVVIDGVPVATVTKVGVYLSAAVGGKLDAEVTADVGFNRDGGEFLVGPVYDGHAWSLPTPDFEAIKPYIDNVVVKAHGELEADIQLRGSVTVDLYDLAGPELSLIPHAELTLTGDIDTTTNTGTGYRYTVTGDLEGSIGIHLAKSLAWLGRWLGDALSDPWQFVIWDGGVLVDGGTPVVDVDDG